MGFSNKQDRPVIQTRMPTSGRGFAAVDPERQREIDVEYARSQRREDFSQLRVGRPIPSGWFSAMRDSCDEGGSVRRSR